jgi:hypothetical protein
MIIPVENYGGTIRQGLCCHEPLLIGVPGNALPDLNLHTLRGDVLYKELEVTLWSEELPTKHMALLYIVIVLLKYATCWSTEPVQSASTTGDPFILPF